MATTTSGGGGDDDDDLRQKAEGSISTFIF